MFHIQRWSIVLVIGTSMVGAALAQAAKKQGEALRDVFVELDTNRDGAVERDEVPASAREAFDRLLKCGDDNHNGKLEAEEFRALLVELRTVAEQAKKQAMDRFKSMDRDGDGKVSREEFTGPKPRFDVLDRDGDGLVTQQEFFAGAPGKAAAKVPAKKKADGVRKPEIVKKAD